MTFKEWISWSYITQAIEFSVIALIALGYRYWKKKQPYKPADFAFNSCPIKNCRLGRGHMMPCWDGTPDPKYDERTK